MPETATRMSRDVAVATIAERIQVVTTAMEAIPESSPLRAFLADLKFTYETLAGVLDGCEPMEDVVADLAAATLLVKAQGKVPFYVAGSDALFALTGIAYVSRGRHV